MDTSKTTSLYRHFLKLTKNPLAAAMLTVAESITSIDIVVSDGKDTPEKPPASTPQKPSGQQ
jgi:hypothetical protein